MKEKKNVPEQEIERTKNKAEICIVCLCWICFFAVISPFLIPAFRNYSGYFARPSEMAGPQGLVRYHMIPTLIEFFDTHKNILSWLFFSLTGLILLFCILLSISKRKKNPYVYPKYYKTLLEFLWILLLELCFIMGYIVNYSYYE